METESELRTAFHDATDEAAVPGFDLDAVRRVKRRQSRRTALTWSASVGAVAFAVVAGTAVLGGARTNAPVAAASPCPEQPFLPAAGWPEGAAFAPGPADVMVPSGAVEVRVCRYDGPEYTLTSATVPMDDGGTAIVDGLNALESQERDLVECPRATFSVFNVVIEHADGATLVAVAPDGCRFVSNGARRGIAAPQSLVDDLTAALNPR
jgi:hypothetical protein